MQRVYIIGPVFLDIITSGISAFPVPGEELYVDSLDLSPGGLAITSMTLHRLGIGTSLISVIGDDQFGRILLDRLKAAGDDLSCVRVRSGSVTNVSLAFPVGNDRSFVTRAMPGREYGEEIIGIAGTIAPEEVQHLHLNLSILRHPGLDSFVRECRLRGATVSCDVGWEEAKSWSSGDWHLLRMVDIFKPNESESLMITGAADTDGALRVLSGYCPHPVITLGSKGAAGVDDSGNIVRADPFRIPVKNAIGAGDGFTAGFLYGFLRKMPMKDCLRLGNATGALTAGSALSVVMDITERKVLELTGKGEIP